jgi:cystathionine beta-lyase/cystathionine gamma-synthase
MKEQNFSSWALDTLLVHSNQFKHTSNNSGIPSVEPISTSTTYLHPNAETLDQAFSGISPSGEPAYVYARQGNPNAQTLEKVLTQAEKGVGAVVFGSGMAAIHAALLASGLTSGSKILAAQDLYGPTIGMLRTVFVPVGVELVLHDLCSPQVIETVRAEQPDVIYIETLSNPLTKVINLDVISAIAKEVGAVSIVDSTFTTPYLIKPIDHGFDMVIHSATKYLGGHGDATAGVVISARNNLVGQLRGYATMLGAMLSPFDSYLISRGLKTLALRMERQCNNALEISQFLQKHKAVERVHYPGLPNHPQHDLASCLLMNHQYGGLLAFELKEQTREAAYRFMDKLQLCLPATTLGDVYTEVSYPAISSHRNLTTSERQKFGITDGCIRFSVGIENVNDLLYDLDQALLSE